MNPPACRCSINGQPKQSVYGITKQGANAGKAYYACSVKKDRGGCGYFMWTNNPPPQQQAPAPMQYSPAPQYNAMQVYPPYEQPNQQYMPQQAPSNYDSYMGPPANVQIPQQQPVQQQQQPPMKRPRPEDEQVDIDEYNNMRSLSLTLLMQRIEQLESGQKDMRTWIGDITKHIHEDIYPKVREATPKVNINPRGDDAP
jgi:hypothetical protein